MSVSKGFFSLALQIFYYLQLADKIAAFFFLLKKEGKVVRLV